MLVHIMLRHIHTNVLSDKANAYSVRAQIKGERTEPVAGLLTWGDMEIFSRFH